MVNKTGFKRVSKICDPNYQKGYYFVYKTKNYKKKCVDLFKLKDLVENEGYVWEVVNVEVAEKTVTGELL